MPRRAPQPQPRPRVSTPTPQPRPPERKQVRRDARTYVKALDQVESDGGALRMGTARSIQLGHDPRVRRRADRIVERRQRREQRQARRTSRREAAELTVARGRAYMAARDTLADNGGVLQRRPRPRHLPRT